MNCKRCHGSDFPLAVLPRIPFPPFLGRPLWGRLLQLAAWFAFLVRVSAAETPVASYALTAADDALLDDLQRTAFRFFAEQAHPRTGLVRDRARADGSESTGKASIAASGFSFSAWVIAADRDWVTRDTAVARIRQKLQFLLAEAPRQRGFFYHFMEMESGERAWKCELSSIDSALLYAGAMVAREYFEDPEITRLVNELLAAVDWDWFRNGGDQVALGWHDETGFSRYRWNHYSEHILMSFLSLGVSERPMDGKYWLAWSRTPVGKYGDFVYIQEPPLFVHQFPQGYLDLRDRRDGHADYFWNSRLATLAQRQFSLDLRKEFPSWHENLWGVTASDSETGYKAWGGPPRTQQFNALDGTIVPCAAAGSLIFAPRETLAVLHHLRIAYGDRIWKRYGFVDAFNPETGWVNPDVLGIDLGISMIQAENLRTGLIHRLFMRTPEVRTAMAKAGLLSTRRVLTTAEQDQVRAQAVRAWHLLQAQSASPGLQLTSVLAAHRLGMLDGKQAVAQARTVISGPLPEDPALLAQFAAGLVSVRQVLPLLAAEATSRLELLPWDKIERVASSLGESGRLAVFFQIARGLREPQEWGTLSREVQPVGPVFALAPATPAGALLPGLWLDERRVLAGASAAQLAYGQLFASSALTRDPLTLALWLDKFPGETLDRYGRLLTNEALGGRPDANAALLIVAANLLTGDSLRHAFQRDALIQTGRSAIEEFAEAAFGPNTSLFAQRELAGPKVVPEQRKIAALPAATPREQWRWERVAGLQFKDSVADVRADDPPLEMQFAFTWDEQALYFHAEVADTPAGFKVPAERNRLVELFVDPESDGLVWQGKRDFQFGFVHTHFWRKPPPGVASESFNNASASASVTITDTEQGYRVEGVIPWGTLGLEPRQGLELGVSPAVVTEGTKEWEPTLKLNWSYYREGESRARLGRLRLE